MNSLKYTVQKMQIVDIAEVSEIADECGVSFWNRVDYRRQIENKAGISLVVKDNTGKILGFLTSRLIIFTNKLLFSDKSAPEFKTQSNNQSNNKLVSEFAVDKFTYRECELEIYNVAVSPAHQLRGAGKILLNKCVESIGDCAQTVVWLEVRRSNIRAVNFYLRNGFKVIYTRKNYYTQPVEDALVMKTIMKTVIGTGAND